MIEPEGAFTSLNRYAPVPPVPLNVARPNGLTTGVAGPIVSAGAQDIGPRSAATMLASSGAAAPCARSGASIVAGGELQPAPAKPITSVISSNPVSDFFMIKVLRESLIKPYKPIHGIGSIRRVGRALALCAATLAGCGAPATMTAPDMALPVEAPIPDIPFGDPLALKPELVYDTGGKRDPITFLGALPGEAELLSLGRDLHSLPSGAAGAITPHELGIDVGVVATSLAFGHGNAAQVLVGGEKGLFAVVAGILERSPLGSQLAGTAVRALFDSGTPTAPEIWIITDTTIHLWHAGVLRRVHIDTLVDGGAPVDLDPAKAQYAACRDPAGGHGRLQIVPAGADDRVLSMPASAALADPATKDARVRVATILVGHPIRALACDGRGVLLAATGDSLLVEIRPDGMVAPGRVSRPITWLRADPGAPEVWFGSADYVAHGRGGAYQIVDADFTPFGGDPPWTRVPAFRVADFGGPLLVAGTQRIGRLRVKAVVELKGLAADVNGPVLVDVSAPYPALIRKIDADLDGTAQWTDLATRRAAIDPWSVPAGKHTFTVTVTYSDGPPLTARADVNLTRPAAPTWTRDVGPVYEARCKKCHGPNGSGHLMATPERWQAEIATILSAINERRMPLPPNEACSGIEVSLVNGWKVTGFSP